MLYPALCLDEGRHLDVLNVVLLQACEGGENRWYASTLELQLVSLELCRACRSVPILHVRVEAGTPRTLWSTDGSRGGIRVARSVSLRRLSFGYGFDQPMAGVVWPASLQRLSFGYGFDQPIAGIVWPASLQRLSFGYGFKQPIAGVVWPASLQRLSFGYGFDQPIAGVVWPASLHQLSLGVRFNQSIAGVV